MTKVSKIDIFITLHFEFWDVCFSSAFQKGGYLCQVKDPFCMCIICVLDFNT